MTRQIAPGLSRRELLASGGALVLSFSLVRGAYAQDDPQARADRPKLAGSLQKNRMLDAWIRIDPDGAIKVFTGKAELGQGIKTALLQVAAEELVVAPAAITMVTADTGRTPDEGVTAGSQSMQNSGTAIRHAAAQVRAILVGLAATRLNLPASDLTLANGRIRGADGREIGYGELVSGDVLHREAEPQSVFIDRADFKVIGEFVPRLDIPGKVTGGVAYVQDLRLEGMVHARVLRPPSYGARLVNLDTAETEKLPGVLGVVRNGRFVAVVAEGEWQAILAMNALASLAEWEVPEELPPQADLYRWIRSDAPTRDIVIAGSPGGGGIADPTAEAVFHRPFQMHASIGPSCAVGLFRDGELTVWSHTQGVFPLRQAISELVSLPPERIRLIHTEGAGCYGHNGADDVGGDAALIAMAFPDRPVRVQWMREDEHGWEPYGSAMVTRAAARLDDSGTIAEWEYEVWSGPHSTRPDSGGGLMPGWHVDPPFALPPPEPIPQPTGGGSRNAIPLYKFASTKVTHHFIQTMPLRVSAHRALGAYANVFSLESFMDELASAAGADPVEFRLKHLEDQRAKDVITLAAEKFGWGTERPPAGRGRGFAFARYKNLAAYVAVALEVEVDRGSGGVRVVRAVAADDSGLAVSPDGIRNQIEGGIIQSISWTLNEAVTFSSAEVTSRDWSGYPILRFSGVPDTVEVHIIDRPAEPFLGTGEAAQGPTAAAIGNAIADATGVRLRELPLTAERVKEALRA